MRRLRFPHVCLILLAGVACGFAAAQVNESPFPGARPLPEDFVEPLFPHISDAEGAIYRKLNEKISVDFDKMPLKDALSFISKTSGIPIIIDLISLEEAGLHVDVDDPVTLQVKDVSIRSILKNLLSDFEMTFGVEDDLLKVTTLEVACIKRTTGIYPVSDLVTDDIDSWKELVRLLQQESDGFWEEIDGLGGTIYMSRATKSLIVRQTPSAHIEIHKLLTFLRAAKRISEERVKSATKPAAGNGFGGQQAPQKGGGFF